MQASVNLSLASNRSSSRRVLHEHHCADRRNRLSHEAIQSPIGCLLVSTPIVCIDNEEASAFGLATLTSRKADLVSSSKQLWDLCASVHYWRPASAASLFAIGRV